MKRHPHLKSTVDGVVGWTALLGLRRETDTARTVSVDGIRRLEELAS